MALNLEQHRVELAWKLTEKYKKAPEWRTQMNGLGTNIHRSGALHALAFIRRDANSEYYEALSESLREHLVDRRFLATSHRGRDLMETLRTLPAYDYMVVSRELLAVSVWLRRSAQILCPR